MRIVHNKERYKRGCAYCADALMIKDKKGQNRRACPYNECPYQELDEFKNYGEYLKAKGSDTMSAIMRELGLGEL